MCFICAMHPRSSVILKAQKINIKQTKKPYSFRPLFRSSSGSFAHHFISDSRVSGVTGTGSEPCASVRPWFSKVQIKEALSSKYFSTSHNFQFTRVCASDPTLSPPPLASWAHAAPGPSLLYTALAFLVVLCRPTLAAQARGGGGGGGGGEAEDNLRLPINLPICRPPLHSAHCSVPAWSSLPPTSLLGGW